MTEVIYTAIIDKPKVSVSERPTLKYAAHAAIMLKNEGDEILRDIAKTQHDLGEEYARKMIMTRPAGRKDAGTAGAVYEKLLKDMSVKYRVVASSDRCFIVHNTGCPFLTKWEGSDASKLCENFGKSFVQGLCDGINPQLRYSITRMMSRGDPYCEEKIELVE